MPVDTPPPPPPPPHRGPRVPRILFLLFLGLTVSACSILPRGERAAPDAAQSNREPVLLEVNNQNFQDARIYVIWDGFRERAGLVNGNTRQTLRLQSRDGQLRVEVDFVAGGGYVTDPIQVWRGETIQLIIPP